MVMIRIYPVLLHVPLLIYKFLFVRPGIKEVCFRSLIFFPVIFLFQACRTSTAPDTGKEDIAWVRIEVAREVSYQKKIIASGRLSPFTELKLSFKTGGVIDNISVKEGQYVNAGEVMAALDLSEISSQLRQAEVMYEKALRDYERINKLYTDSAATLEQLQNAGTALEIAESSRTIARFNFDHSVIAAPSGGRVLRLLAEENEIIASGFPVILFATSPEKWLLKVAVTDRDIVHIKEGDHAEIFFDAYPGKVFESSVTEISGMSDPYTGTFEVSLVLSGGDRKLMPGFIGKAEILTSEINRYLGIPHEAIIEASGRSATVFQYVNGVAAGGVIRIEEITDEMLLVTGDIEKGDTIVTAGAAFIREGQRLMISDF